VLGDGYGQCNTKGTLLIALLRAGGVPARFHGFTIDNALQKGAIPGYIFPLAPKEIIHSWVEIEFQGLWVNLEGFILDKPYLQGVRSLFPESTGAFSGYAIATNSIEEPPIDWNGSDTYIQSEGIARDFGVFDDPDSFYELHGTNLSGLKRFLYRYLVRHLMNWNVRRIRRR
jgi:transglutaminase-like putative cysteine protease